MSTIKISREIKTKSASLFYKESRILANFTIKALALNCETQSIECLVADDLKQLKHDIKIKHKNLVFELKTHSYDKWPMLKHGILIKELVFLRQKYLAKLSKLHGYNSKITQLEVLNFLTQIDMRIFAVDSLLRSKGSKTAGIDHVILTRYNALEFLDLLTFKKLKVYKASPVKIISVTKIGSNESRQIATIYDRLVQKLFLLVLDPIIDVHSDKSSYGYRNGRNAHQSIGLVASILSKRTNKEKTYIVRDKHILKFDIKSLFGSVSHDWLINNYPFPFQFKFILKQWLNYEESFFFDPLALNVSNDNLGFAHGSVIAPSLVNFTLDGLEFECKPSQKTAVDEKKKAFLDAQNIKYKPSSGIVRKILTSTVTRFAYDFLVITNDDEQLFYIFNKIKDFLSIRGLTLNDENIQIIHWKNHSKFDFLGFTFHFLTKPKPGRVTEQRNSNNQREMRGGLYVYPSDDSISKFKKRIKLLFLKNLNLTPYKLLLLLNPIIRAWGNYFAVGTKRVFSRIDHFIWYRSWRWLRRKFKKVSTKKLVSRFYAGAPTGLAWHFHATWNNASKDQLKRKGKILHIILLTRLTPGIPAQAFKPTKEILNESYFINQEASVNWNTSINRYKLKVNHANFWSKLYNKQQGLCTLCKQDLGYFNSDNLEIHHKVQVAVNPKLIHKFENQELVHIACHKTVPILKRTSKKVKVE